MVAAYVAAGYEKIHLDTSMGCKGEPDHLGDLPTAERAAQLAAIAEQAKTSGSHGPLYVVGTEVPTPGGAHHKIAHLEPTRPETVFASIEAHRSAFAGVGASEAFERVIAVVAQPGAEFDNEDVVVYRPSRLANCATLLHSFPALFSRRIRRIINLRPAWPPWSGTVSPY